MDKSLKILCKVCNKKKDCISLCSEALEHLDPEKIKSSFNVDVAESYHKKSSGAYQKPKTIADMQIDGANKDDVQKLNKPFFEEVFKDLPQQYTEYFRDFLSCTKMTEIALLSKCTKQNIQQRFDLRISRIAVLTGIDNEKVRTPHQFKMKFALTDVIL
jgi:hypothetical protein